MRHGLLAARLLLPDEDRRELSKLRATILDSLAPQGGLEELLAERVIAAAWRLRRSERIEAESFERSRRQWNSQADLGVGHAFAALCVNGDMSTKLSRYEAALERALYRALHELQRLQAGRAGVAVPLPVSVDVDVTHTTGGLDSGSFGSGDAEIPPPIPVLTED